MAVLPVLATLAFLTYFVSTISLHVLPTGLDPLEHALSHYAVGPYRRVSRVAGTASIIGVALLWAALVTTVHAPPLENAGLAALALVAVTRIGTRAFPINAPGSPPTWCSRIHLLLAAATFVAATTAVQTLTRNLSRLPAWHAVLPALALPARLSFPLLVLVGLTFLAPPLRRVFGLAERLFVLCINGWLLIVAGFMSARALGVL